MKVSISVGGRFHAFDLAKQLEKRGYLQKLITSYPYNQVKRYGIPREKVKSLITKEVIQRGWRSLPYFIRNNFDPQYSINNIFDKKSSKFIENPDIFVGWTSISLHGIRRGNKQGSVTIAERGSAHIEKQRDLLLEEYNRLGVDGVLPPKKTVEKELKEYEEADYISIPSVFVKESFLEKGYSENKLIHVPYGVDLSEFKQVKKNDDKFRVIFAGGMTIQKGVHYLLKAFSELDLPNSELMLLGSVSDDIKPFFEKYKGSYKFLGNKPQKELYKYYSQGSVFVLPSIQDGFGMVMAQAMACGLPVIATENTGSKDIIENGENGFIIPIRDVDSLKEKLIYIYENPKKLEKMREASKNKVLSGFSWDDYGEKIVEEYRRVLK